ncbi:MAG: mechanosensitive ion channel family protein [Pseudomonadota bacterium]|nr:mechanosensitive ion channel family protein [Pseudomonadota bacterium]
MPLDFTASKFYCGGVSEQIRVKTMNESAFQLWEQTLTVWHDGLWGVDIGRMISAVAILFGFMLLRGLFSRYVLGKLHKLTDKTKNEYDDRIVDALIPPVRFIPVVMGIFFAAHYAGLNDSSPEMFSRIIRSLIAFNIFWGLYRIIMPLSHALRRLNEILTPTMVQWLFKFLSVLTIFLGAAIILEIWGIKVGPLLAGLGILGAAVAFGAQDLFKNLLGGITILAEQKFHPGDWIKVDGVVEGTVDAIGFRSTQVRRFDKAPVQVPNSTLSDAAITNFSRMTNRRIYWKIGVAYGTSVDQLKIIRDGIMDYLQNSDEIEQPPKVAQFVRVDAFNDSSIDFMIYTFTKTTDWGEWLRVKEEFAFFIKELVENKAGTSFAFPSTSLYIESMPNGDAPEAFVPPNDNKAA